MQTLRDRWSDWAEQLRRLGLQGIAAWALYAAAPLRLLGAQALYFSQPFFEDDRVSSLTRLLEDDHEAHAFASFLQEEMRQ